ncbi:hypothetical protein RBH20_09145 [Haloarcula sp. H-GB4]|uniref:hypothetical protein n=1 Tax=Haloarcula sp. H-GB4 TaxID=3069755 RepID=UPI0027B84732|nr:hypothetical protein [Haloarcula sp. H-GB4]MDQ2072699.1 hypothetical protein [Haloarcula sp. H-GB4]
MSYGTDTGSTPRTEVVESPAQKSAVRPRTEYRVRCPDCKFSKRFDSYADATSHQRRHSCPHCDRMVGLSEVPNQRRNESLDAAEAVAAACEARRELLIDGPAPSVSEILDAMGRDGDGYPLGEKPAEDDAFETARQLLAPMGEA